MVADTPFVKDVTSLCSLLLMIGRDKELSLQKLQEKLPEKDLFRPSSTHI